MSEKNKEKISKEIKEGDKNNLNNEKENLDNIIIGNI